MDEKERLCYLTIVGGRIYRRECAESSYEVVDSVIYKNADGRYSTLTLPFPEYGIDYFHRASQSQKVHADLIGNPEVSEYYGGGDKIESSANYDGTLFAKNHQNKVTGIHIRSGEILDGIGFVYTGDDEFFFGSSTGGGETRIRFNMDEYIVRMTGAVNEIYPYYYCITNLRIITNKNPHGYGPFGSHKGEKTFSFGKDGKMIAAVLGEETTQEKWRYNLVKRIAVAYADITV
jgi:hypothetical protein